MKLNILRMDKPQTLSIKDWIIRNMSTKNNIPERIIEEVVNHQFESARKAMDTMDSLEFSGFGKLLFNMGKALKKVEKQKSQISTFNTLLAGDTLTDIRRRNLEMKLASAHKNLEHLKKKINLPIE